MCTLVFCRILFIVTFNGSFYLCNFCDGILPEIRVFRDTSLHHALALVGYNFVYEF